MGEIRKYTSEMLMRDMGLQVGDRIKIDNKIFEIYISPLDDIRCGNIHNANNHFNITKLIDQDIEILPRPKRVGDLKCGEYGKQNCGSCPIRAICVSDEYNNDTLYEKLELSHKYAKDQEIYDLLKARLDKEVE